jgi:hypothetical protein
MTLREYLESNIAHGEASDIGERRWAAERLRFLLADYDAHLAGEPSHADNWAEASRNDPGASMEVARL